VADEVLGGESWHGRMVSGWGRCVNPSG
jgi:hypothetical protein